MNIERILNVVETIEEIAFSCKCSRTTAFECTRSNYVIPCLRGGFDGMDVALSAIINFCDVPVGTYTSKHLIEPTEEEGAVDRYKYMAYIKEVVTQYASKYPETSDLEMLEDIFYNNPLILPEICPEELAHTYHQIVTYGVAPTAKSMPLPIGQLLKKKNEEKKCDCNGKCKTCTCDTEKKTAKK